MKLTATEKASPLWEKIQKHLDDKIESHRKANDSLVLTEIETAQKRGRIAELKSLLQLSADDPDENESGRQ